jgi:hypothetical protein
VEATGRALARVFHLMPDLPGEVAAKLARLDPTKVHVARFAWHASNDHTVEPWAKNISPRGGLRTVSTRPGAEQELIARSLRDTLAALMADPRVRVISLDNDTQYAEENRAEAGHQAAFGLGMAEVPELLTAANVESVARTAGLSIPKSQRRTRRQPRR